MKEGNKKRTVAIHQPNFMPWLGYFDKMRKADVFVFIDNVQFVKGHICNRNRIKNNQGKAVWLTVPVNMPKGAEVNFNELPIDYGQKWQPKIINALRGAYQKSPYFDQYIDPLKEIFGKEFPHLAALNIALIKYFKEILNIKTELAIASELNQNFGTKNEMNLNICKYFDGNIYLSGQGARKYNDENLFEEHGVELQYLDFDHPTYSQLHGEFIPNLSIIDLLFNCGPDSLKVFEQ